METLIIILFSIVGIWLWSVITGMYEVDEVVKFDDLNKDVDFNKEEGIYTIL